MLRDFDPSHVLGNPLISVGLNTLPPLPTLFAKSGAPRTIGVWHSMQCPIVARYRPRVTASRNESEVYCFSASATAARMTGILYTGEGTSFFTAGIERRYATTASRSSAVSAL